MKHEKKLLSDDEKRTYNMMSRNMAIDMTEITIVEKERENFLSIALL